MQYYLIFFGLLVLGLFLAGIFYTVREFREMSENPDDYRTGSDDSINIEAEKP